MKRPDEMPTMNEHERDYAGRSPEPVEADDAIDLFQLWETLAGGWRLIALITLVCTALATAAAFIMTPYYQSDVLLAPADDDGAQKGIGGLAQFGGLAEMAGISVGGVGKEEGVALLKSRVIVEQFITENNLLPIIYAKKWDATAKRWNVEDPEEIPTLNQAYSLFDKKIRSVNADKKTGLVTLSITWKDRELAAAWAADLVKRVNQRMRTLAVAEAQRSLEFLNAELKKTSVVEVQQAIYRLMESQVKTIMVANTREQYAFKVIDPPVVSDAGNFARPKRVMIIGLAMAAGFMLGVLAVFARAGWRRRAVAGQAA